MESILYLWKLAEGDCLPKLFPSLQPTVCVMSFTDLVPLRIKLIWINVQSAFEMLYFTRNMIAWMYLPQIEVSFICVKIRIYWFNDRHLYGNEFPLKGFLSLKEKCLSTTISLAGILPILLTPILLITCERGWW